MQPSRWPNKIFAALCVNAVVLILILLAVVSRDGRSALISSAYAQQQPPIAGGSGTFVMPAQLSPNTWGCYVMDVEHQTLCVYQYSPGEKMLRLSAARNFDYDRQLSNFNTLPPPADIRDLVEREKQPVRGNDTVKPKSPETP